MTVPRASVSGPVRCSYPVVTWPTPRQSARWPPRDLDWSRMGVVGPRPPRHPSVRGYNSPQEPCLLANLGRQENSIGHVILVAITGTTILVPHLSITGYNHWNYLQNYVPKMSFKFPRGQWVKVLSLREGEIILWDIKIWSVLYM